MGRVQGVNPRLVAMRGPIKGSTIALPEGAYSVGRQGYGYPYPDTYGYSYDPYAYGSGYSSNAYGYDDPPAQYSQDRPRTYAPPPTTANAYAGDGKWHHFGEKPGP